MALTLEEARARLAQIDIPVVEKPTVVSVKSHPVFAEARSILDKYGLTDWRFHLSNEKRAGGRCFYSKKKIVFSKYYLDADPLDITDVLLHEAAHALAWTRYGSRGRGHGELWKRTAIEIGARPERCHHMKSSAEPKYLVSCPHGCTWNYHRRPTDMHLRTCREHKAALTVTHIETGAVILK